MQKTEKRLITILKRAKQAGITSEVITEVISREFEKVRSKKPETSFPEVPENFAKVKFGSIVLVIIFCLIIGKWYFWEIVFDSNLECLIHIPFDETKVFRKPEDCSMCLGVTQVDRVTNISQHDFDNYYASRAKPVIITDGTRDWSALESFNFKFFKNLYEKHSGGKTVCQFFPYKTEFNSLREVLNMSEARSKLEEGTKPWYIGWSNCNDGAGQELRKHYNRPYFLPDISENMALSWMFMGGPGEGAHMHVDNVHYASWQAQLRGRKRWRLASPPECYYACAEFSAVVEPGEIIAVDTNRWYHQTHILPGDISITIGTEFD